MIEKLSDKHQGYCAIKFMLDMKDELSNFTNDENVKISLLVMLTRLSCDLELSQDEFDHLAKLLGI